MKRTFRLAAMASALLAAGPAAATAAGTAALAIPAPAMARHGTAGGTRLWVARYQHRGPRPESIPAAVAVSPDGSTVYVAGRGGGNVTSRSANFVFATVAYNAATGKPRWVAQNPPGSATAIAVSGDGSTVFVTGSSGSGTMGDYQTVAYNSSTGAIKWTATYQGPGVLNGATAIAQSPDGSTVFVTGHSSDQTNNNYEYATVAYNAATGAQLWAVRYDGDNLGAFANAVAVSPDGSTVFVTGGIRTDNTPVTDDYATLAYDAATGAQLRVQTYQNGPAGVFDYGTALAVSPDGATLFVTGTPATLAYNAATGATRWSRLDGATSLLLSPDGAAVFGAGLVGNTDAYFTVALDAATGARLWRHPEPHRADFAPPAIAINPAGTEIFLAGQGRAEAINAATGARLWVRADPGPPLGGWSSPVAVSPDGSHVFVSAVGASPTNREEWVTAAYSP